MLNRYTKFVLTVIALALVVLVTRPFVEPHAAFGGLTQEETKKLLSTAPGAKVIPKSWGRFVGTFTLSSGAGTSFRYVTFEDPDGTLRTAGVCSLCEVVRK
jgi:hypothetical protein